MKYIKKIASSLVLLSLFIGALAINTMPVSADNNKNSANSNFTALNASMKMDSLIKEEAVVAVMLGANNNVRVMNANVASVTGTEINANAMFGNSTLAFVVRTNADTKINGKSNSLNLYPITLLKAGDKVSFSGSIVSSGSSSLVINSDYVISRVLFNLENKTNFQGKIDTINTADNTFTLKMRDQTVKVITNNLTVITNDKTNVAFASLVQGNGVRIVGTLSTDKTQITATKVTVDKINDRKMEDKKDNNRNDDQKNNGNKQSWFGKMMSNWFSK